MKFSKKTIEILNNFVNINDSIIFRPGQEIASKAVNGTIIAFATVEETFPVEFAVFNLSEFLSVISLFDDPDIEFTDTVCTISEKGKQVKYAVGNRDLIRNKPESDYETPPWDIEFNCKLSDFKQVMKASSVLGQDLILFKPDGEGNLIARTANSLLSQSDTNESYFDIKVGKTELTDFEASFPQKSLNLMEYDYDVSINFEGISQFKAPDITYWVALSMDNYNE